MRETELLDGKEYILSQEELDHYQNIEDELKSLKKLIEEYLQFKSIDGNSIRQLMRQNLRSLIQ
jgi:hypothetical protein